MKRVVKLWLTLIVITTGLLSQTTTLQAKEPLVMAKVRRLVPICCEEPLPSGPDDYCRKPIPCLPCLPGGCCDDYCRKPIPCVTCPPPGVHCDDYCRKPLPPYCRLTPIPYCAPCSPSTSRHP